MSVLKRPIIKNEAFVIDMNEAIKVEKVNEKNGMNDEKERIILPQIKQLLGSGVYPINDRINQSLLKHIVVQRIFTKVIRLSVCVFYAVRSSLAIILNYNVLPDQFQEILFDVLIYLGDFTRFMGNDFSLNVYFLLIISANIIIESVLSHRSKRSEVTTNIINKVFGRESDTIGIKPEAINKIYEDLEKRNRKFLFLVRAFVAIASMSHLGKFQSIPIKKSYSRSSFCSCPHFV